MTDRQGNHSMIESEYPTDRRARMADWFQSRGVDPNTVRLKGCVVVAIPNREKVLVKWRGQLLVTPQEANELFGVERA